VLDYPRLGRELSYLIGNIEPHRTENGDTLEHAKYMAEELAKGYMSEGKAARWLGWTQCILCFLKVTTLETEKLRNLAAKLD
jgi:hypothetical protein